MTTQELIDYYTGLLIIQYAAKPKAKAHVAALVTPVIMDQLPLAVQDAFKIGTAVGTQLDVIGKYAGISRTGYTPSGIVTLNDTDFTTLIRLVLIKNTAGSSLATIQSLLAASFGNQIRISDNQTMQINYVIKNTFGSTGLLDMLTYGNFLPKPMGVQVAVTVVPDIDDPFFGGSTYTVPAGTSFSPLNSYAFFQDHYPWLSYGGVINV